MEEKRRIPDWLILAIRVVWCAVVLPTMLLILVTKAPSVWTIIISIAAWIMLLCVFFFVTTTSFQDDRKVATEKRDNDYLDKRSELDKAVYEGAENKPSDAVCITVRVIWYTVVLAICGYLVGSGTMRFVPQVFFIVGCVIIRTKLPTSRQRARRYYKEKKEREYLEKKYGKKDQE